MYIITERKLFAINDRCVHNFISCDDKMYSNLRGVGATVKTCLLSLKRRRLFKSSPNCPVTCLCKMNQALVERNPKMSISFFWLERDGRWGLSPLTSLADHQKLNVIQK